MSPKVKENGVVNGRQQYQKAKTSVLRRRFMEARKTVK
jgi:hypothetical protein